MIKKKLCCIFNYAPLYRKSIYNKIDAEFDAQFYFGDMESDIAQMDYAEFNRQPRIVRDRKLFGKLLWRKDILCLPLKSYQYYLITGDSSLSYIPFIVLCKLFCKKVYAWGHGCKTFGRKMSWFNKFLYHNCDVFFVYGEQGRRRLLDLGVPSEKLQVIYNSLNAGVDGNLQKDYKSDMLKKHFDNTLPTIIFIGRLTAVKQLDWIIKAMERHNNQGFLYNAVLVGDGSESGSLKSLVRDLDLEDRVWFYGECYNEDEISKLLYNADLCVSPGNVGLTALHSMSYGTPVLSHDDFETQMPEYETIVPGITGELYHKGDFDDFCAKIKSFLLATEDRNAIRQNCYDMINKRFNSEYQITLLKTWIN